MQLKQLKLYDLPPLDLLVFNLVALASVQRSVRETRLGDERTGDIRPMNETNGTISRRRIADATGVARTTVARSLERLIARGMMVERGRGKLQVPVGIVLQGPYACDPAELFSPIVKLFEQFVRLGLVNITAPDLATVAQIVSVEKTALLPDHQI